MGRIWVLQTETKGTGANMVPLERARKGPANPVAPFKPPKRRPLRAKAPEPKQPRRFKVVDVMTQQSLAEDVGVHDALDALQGVRSTVDVSVYVWHEDRERWRRLTFSEQRALLDLAHAAGAGEAMADSSVST